MASSGTPTRPRVTTLHIDNLKRRRSTIAEIAAGRLPTLDEIISGMGFAHGDWKSDCRLWCTDLLLGGNLESDAIDRFEHLRKACSRNALKACMTALEHVFEDGREIIERLTIYLAADNDPDAHARVVRMLLTLPYGRPDFRRVTFGIAVARSQTALCKPDAHTYAAESIISGTAADIAMSHEAARMIAAMAQTQTPEEALHEQIEENVQAMLEDRAEIDPTIEPPVGLIVLPAAEALKAAKGHKKEILAPYLGILGATLPLIKAPNPVETVERFRKLMPHAVEAFIRILGHHQEGDDLQLGQWLLVGPPGSGKTTMIRSIAESLGLPVEVHGMGGAIDSSVMGTSAQWSTARAHPILQLINQHKIANPIIGWDEIEKTGTSRQNGNALDALLPILEKHTSRKHRDLALEVEVDLSAASHIATANTLEGVPAPILDRFRIVKMPEPTWQHIGALSRTILNRIAEDRGLDPRWFPDLEGDEIEVITKVWPGGSIRKLERAVRRIVDGRENYMGRA